MLRQSKGGWNINSQKIVLTNGGGISGYDGFNNIANYWSWKVDIVLMLITIGVNIYFWIK